MRNDPIVEEIRAARAKLMDECDQDLSKLMDRLQASESQHQNRVVTVDSLKAKQTPRRSPQS